VKIGIGVSKPLAPERYDLIFDVGVRLVRVQCKWAAHYGDVIVVRCRSSRRGANGYIRRDYTKDEIDAIAAYCLAVDQCYFFDIQGTSQAVIQLRLAPSRNNQRIGVNCAKDFEFEATLGSVGAVAQLGERQHGMLEATGSSPVGSIVAPTLLALASEEAARSLPLPRVLEQSRQRSAVDPT
jgi:hypothetical protein